MESSEVLPSIYVLRKAKDPLPNQSDTRAGDVVIMHSGDIMVNDGGMWYLLPGRYLEPEQLKLFIRYVASGWPSDPSLVEGDMADLKDKRFLSEMIKVAEKICQRNQASPTLAP
jgi:hypothetical protein